jgi:hypothetical protein
MHEQRKIRAKAESGFFGARLFEKFENHGLKFKKNRKKASS